MLSLMPSSRHVRTCGSCMLWFKPMHGNISESKFLGTPSKLGCPPFVFPHPTFSQDFRAIGGKDPFDDK